MTSPDYNRKLLADYLATSKVYSRYPKVSEQAECLPLDTSKLPPFAYNPSLMFFQGHLWMTYRYHHKGDFYTRIGIAEIGDGGTILRTQDLVLHDDHSCEDARLFSLHGEMWMSWVEAKDLGKLSNTCVVKYGRLEMPPGKDLASRSWTVTDIHQPTINSNDWTSTQKNWCFFESDENLFCLFRSYPELKIFQVQGDVHIQELRTPGIRWPYGQIRGASILPFEGKLLRFFHSTTEGGIDGREHRKYIGCALMERTLPFKTLAVSSKPILYGSEIDVLTPEDRKRCFHWHSGVAFPGVAMKDKDGFLMAVGVNDSACCIVRITKEMLNL